MNDFETLRKEILASSSWSEALDLITNRTGAAVGNHLESLYYKDMGESVQRQLEFPNKKKKVYIIECRTGCTCCSGDNFYEGFFLDKSEAESKIAQYQKGEGNPLASQYATYGNYSLKELEAEMLPGGRAIIGSNVFDSLEYVHTLGHPDSFSF